MKQLLSPDKNNLEKYIVESEGEAEADEGLVIKQKALHCVAVAGRDRPGAGCRGGKHSVEMEDILAMWWSRPR